MWGPHFKCKVRGAHLMAELVAGHSQDNEPLSGVALVKLVHLGVIPGGRTSKWRDILDEDHLASQGGEIEPFSRQQVSGKLVEVGHIVTLVILVSSVSRLSPNVLNASRSPWLYSVILQRSSVGLSRELTPRTHPFGTAFDKRHRKGREEAHSYTTL